MITYPRKIYYIFALLGVLFLPACSLFVSYEKVYLDNEKEFNEFADWFLEQDKINNISLGAKYYKSCQNINGWGKCPFIGGQLETNWGKETGEMKDGLREKIYLDYREDVLEYEGITQKEYVEVVSFLLKHKLRFVGKDDEEQVVDLGGIIDGLRYYHFEENDFQEDSIYEYVERINEHWYLYGEDLL